MHSDKDIPTIHSSWNWNTAQECLSKIVSIQTDKSTVEKNVTNFIFFSFEKQNTLNYRMITIFGVKIQMRHFGWFSNNVNFRGFHIASGSKLKCRHRFQLSIYLQFKGEQSKPITIPILPC